MCRGAEPHRRTHPLGWLSPRCTPSAHTSRLLARAGFRWHADMFDADLPYRIDTAEGSLVGMPFTMEVNDMPLYVRYGNEPEAFTRTLARIVEGWDRLGSPLRASTSPCMRTSSAGRMARSRCSTRLRWCAGRTIAGSPIMRGSRSCRRDDMAKFVIAPHMRLHEWVAEEKGYFAERRPRLRVPRRTALGERAAARSRRSGRRVSDDREGPHVGRELRLPLDGERRRLGGTRQAVCRLLFGGAGGHLRAGGFAGHRARAACRRADLGGLPVGQPLFGDPGAGAVHADRRRSGCRSPMGCCSGAWRS